MTLSNHFGGSATPSANPLGQIKEPKCDLSFSGFRYQVGLDFSNGIPCIATLGIPSPGSAAASIPELFALVGQYVSYPKQFLQHLNRWLIAHRHLNNQGILVCGLPSFTGRSIEPDSEAAFAIDQASGPGFLQLIHIQIITYLSGRQEFGGAKGPAPFPSVIVVWRRQLKWQAEWRVSLDRSPRPAQAGQGKLEGV